MTVSKRGRQIRLGEAERDAEREAVKEREPVRVEVRVCDADADILSVVDGLPVPLRLDDAEREIEGEREEDEEDVPVCEEEPVPV